MGCGANAGDSATKGEAYSKFLQTKEKVRASPSYNTLCIFYNQLYPLAQNIMKSLQSFDDVLYQLDKFAQVIQDFKNIGPLAPLADILSVLPIAVKPALQAAKPVLLNMQDGSNKFLKEYAGFYQSFKPFFDLLKELEDKKSKFEEPGKRYEHGKLVLEYGRQVADSSFKVDHQLETTIFMALVKFIQGFQMIDKLSKEVSKVGDLTNKDVPLTGKKVRDFFEQGGSNMIVAGVKKAIEKASQTIEQNVNKVEKYISKIEIYEFPKLKFQLGKLQVKEKVGNKRNVLKSLPEDFVSRHAE